ncbi:27 kDa hemolymph protein-like [Pseudomyrmex gracilis]|uniref:27 kDa hemolymph protein-like n=1 Tax=Pseudomyrmex gracilis TaxID=219809 RepID=UPI000995CAF0|nr:27 kDa hemolymph protein-like [Pseudomyrmex gracilis]
MLFEAKMKCCITFTVVTLLLCFNACAYSQDSSSVDNVQNLIGDIPELKNVNASGVQAQAENLFKEKCKRNGGPNAFENIDRAKTEMVECVQSLINITDLQSEIDKYKSTGDLDIVFKRYCNKRFTLRACVTNFTSTLEACLDEKEKENIKIVLNITDSLLEFTCFKEGERIALFIAAGGPECIESKKDAIQDCANKTYSSRLPTSNSGGSLDVENLPTLLFDTKECRDMVSLQNCVVAELENCPDPTTANLVNSIFNYVKRVTPCENLLIAQSAAATGSQAESSGVSYVSVFSTVTILSIIASYVGVATV